MKTTTSFRRFLASTVCVLMLITFTLPSFADGTDCCAGLIPGDATGDGSVDLKDTACMLRYCAGWDPKINLDNADVHNDGAVNLRDVSLMIRALAGWTNVRLGHLDSTEPVIEATCTEAGVNRLVCANCGSSVEVETPPVGHKYESGICIRCGILDEAYASYYTAVEWVKEKGTADEEGNYSLIVDQNIDLYGYGDITLFSLAVFPDDSTVLVLSYAYQPDDQSYYQGTLLIDPSEKKDHSFSVDYYYVDGQNIMYNHTDGTLDNSKKAHFSEGYWGYSDSDMSYTSNLGALSSAQLKNLESLTDEHVVDMFREAEFDLILDSGVSLADFGFILY